jgi:hypothetical protein
MSEPRTNPIFLDFLDGFERQACVEYIRYSLHVSEWSTGVHATGNTGVDF